MGGQVPPRALRSSLSCANNAPKLSVRYASAKGLVSDGKSSSCTTGKAELLGVGRWRRPERFELDLDGAERFEAHAISSATSNHEAIAVAVEAIDLDHAFERIDEPNARDALAGVDRKLAFTIDALAARRDHLTSPVGRQL